MVALTSCRCFTATQAYVCLQPTCCMVNLASAAIRLEHEISVVDAQVPIEASFGIAPGTRTTAPLRGTGVEPGPFRPGDARGRAGVSFSSHDEAREGA